MSNVIELTIEEFQDKIEIIMESYAKGDDTNFRITTNTGVVMCIPYDGPYEEKVQQDEEGNLFVNIPERVLSKLGIKEGDEVNLEVTSENNILITKKEV